MSISTEEYIKYFHPIEYHSLLRIIDFENCVTEIPSEISEVIPFLVSEFKKICRNFMGHFSFCPCENTCEIYTNLNINTNELDKFIDYINNNFNSYYDYETNRIKSRGNYIVVIKRYNYNDKLTIGIILSEYEENEVGCKEDEEYVDQKEIHRREFYDLFEGHETIESLFK